MLIKKNSGYTEHYSVEKNQRNVEITQCVRFRYDNNAIVTKYNQRRDTE